jgi:hypothetical protein
MWIDRMKRTNEQGVRLSRLGRCSINPNLTADIIRRFYDIKKKKFLKKKKRKKRERGDLKGKGRGEI